MSRSDIRLNTLSSDDELALANYTDDIGKIVMTFERGKFTKVRREDKSDPVQRKENPHAHNSADLKVHECSKKGREHQVGFVLFRYIMLHYLYQLSFPQVFWRNHRTQNPKQHTPMNGTTVTH
jgi:hypothetical protein